MTGDSPIAVALVGAWMLGAGVIIGGGLWLTRQTERVASWALDELSAAVVRSRERRAQRRAGSTSSPGSNGRNSTDRREAESAARACSEDWRRTSWERDEVRA